MMDLSKISQDDVGFYIERTEDRKGLAFYIYAKTDTGMKYLDAVEAGEIDIMLRKLEE